MSAYFFLRAEPGKQAAVNLWSESNVAVRSCLWTRDRWSATAATGKHNKTRVGQIEPARLGLASSRLGSGRIRTSWA